MTRKELVRAETPFSVRHIGTGETAIVKGFSDNDPLGVGGGIMPDMPVAYFDKGGWLLVEDLLKHYELVVAA